MQTEGPNNIFDNTQNKEILQVIKNQLKNSKYAKFAIGYFFLSGFNLVKEDFSLDKDKEGPFLKIVMGNETTLPTKEELVAGYTLRDMIKQKMVEDIQKNIKDQKQIAKLEELRDFIAKGVIEVKLYDKAKMHAKLYLFLTDPNSSYSSPGLALVGSSNFTSFGLTENKELNVSVTDRRDVVYLDKWFDTLWEESLEFREDLLKVIEFSGIIRGKDYPRIGNYVDPITLFKFLVYNWFDGRITNLVKKDILMEFQVVGVINAVNIISHFNGVILADSVGLGKSFMASQIIEEFIEGKYPSWCKNEKHPSVLLVLPPSIINQWEDLLIGRMKDNEKENGLKVKCYSEFFFTDNYKRKVNDFNEILYQIYDSEGKNLLGKIGFLSLGVFQNLYSNRADEDNIELKRLSNTYDLFVIDEAHKYRNKNTNRWKALRKLQKKEDEFENKFILLTATPLNNSIFDIYNIIRLFSDDSFMKFRQKNIHISGLMDDYRGLKREIERNDDDNLRNQLNIRAKTIKDRVLDEIMVLRTRSYITEEFKDLKVNGKQLIFKDPRPYTVDYSSFITKDFESLIHLIRDALNSLFFEYTKIYGTRYVIFEEEKGSEESAKNYVEISDLFKLLLGKRLESSVYSFETTLRRIYEKEKIFLRIFKSDFNLIISLVDIKNSIEKCLKQAKIDIEIQDVLENYDIEEERENWFTRVTNILLEYSELEKDKTKQYTYEELLKIGLSVVMKNMENDLKNMDEIIKKLDSIKENQDGMIKNYGKIPKKTEDIVEIPIYEYKKDPKLLFLKQIIGNPKFKSKSITAPSLYGKKILIFTQYRDTAYYIYNNLKDWVEKDTDFQNILKDSENRIKIGLVTGDTDTETKINFMKRFSPNSNDGYDIIKKFGAIQILVSTDSLSEGVNLQDADAIINFDLPWNPMIIVQRVGRVNRIGNDKDIDVLNYIPTEEIEILVGVLNKLKEKINDITLVVGKETKILDPKEEITVETFGEKIKSISKLNMTKLEEYGISDDFKSFIPKDMNPKILDEYKLLHKIQYELGFTSEDFEDIKKMEEIPYFTNIIGNDKIVMASKIYSGNQKIGENIISIDKDGKEKYETPMIFYNLVENLEASPKDIDFVMESLNQLEKIMDNLKKEEEKGQKRDQKGFLRQLYMGLYDSSEDAELIPKRFNEVMIALQNVNSSEYSKDIKGILIGENLIEERRNDIQIKDLSITIDKLYDFLKEKGISTTESLELKIKKLGWFHETKNN